MADSNTKPNSTAQSYLDQATSAVQSGVAYITGSQPDAAQAEQRASDAQAQNEASHTAARLGNVTATPGGGIATDSTDRSQGSWNQTVGAAKEALGGLTGVQSLKQSGAEQNAAGKEQEARGQLSDLGQGLGDRVKGTLGETVAGLRGDAEGKEQYAALREDGKAMQRGVESDLQKSVEAEQGRQQQ